MAGIPEGEREAKHILSLGLFVNCCAGVGAREDWEKLVDNILLDKRADHETRYIGRLLQKKLRENSKE